MWNFLRSTIPAVLTLITFATAVGAANLRMAVRRADPYGTPRPARGATDVPLRTTIWFELELQGGEPGDHVDRASIHVRLCTDGAAPIALVEAGKFVPPTTGWLTTSILDPNRFLAYIDPGTKLTPETTYTVQLDARSARGIRLEQRWRRWRFTTGPAPEQHRLDYRIDFTQRPVRWHGVFFPGFCNVVFCTNAAQFGPMYRAMRAVRKHHPRGWRYRRDVWLMGDEQILPDWARFMHPHWPNMVREQETRRVVSIEYAREGVVLRVTDVFGCDLYGVKPGRPLRQDYKPGYEALVTDGTNVLRSTVKAVDDERSIVTLAAVPPPPRPWKLRYRYPPPQRENPDYPGRFPAGGTYLRRFRPSGTPVYYWKRLDKELDLALGLGIDRLVVNFTDPPPALSIDGTLGSRPKDYVQWHEVVRTVTDHIIGRYGDAACKFRWAVFNEPDLADYWRKHWDEAQRFYDYTVDAVLRAF